MTTLQDFTVTDIDDRPVDLAQYAGEVVLIVNTASECGFTPQYLGLEELHQKYASRGLVVMGFPSNDFAQEPAPNPEIALFCQEHYGVTFPIMSKTHVNGDDADPLFLWLRRSLPGMFGDHVKWNFTKFLIGRDGRPIKRFGPTRTPRILVKEIEKALA